MVEEQSRPTMTLRDYSIQNNCDNETMDEESPLLNSLRWRPRNLRTMEKLFIAVLLTVLLAGFSAGAYLLLTEGTETTIHDEFSLISRQSWEAQVSSSPMPNLTLPASKVLFLQTNSTNCDNRLRCSHLLRQLQSRHMEEWKEPDIVYNFVVGGDGNFYEGLGWNFQTTFPDYCYGNTVVVAFAGDANSVLLWRQMESAKVFLEVAAIEGKLVPCYNLQTLGDNEGLNDAADSISRDILYDCNHVLS